MKFILTILLFLSLITKANQYCIDIDYSIPQHQIELNRFMTDIGHKESTNNYKCINPWGHLGKYQFSPKTLKGLGYDVSVNKFLNDSLIQDEAMLSLMKENHKILKKDIIKYNNTTINGVKITESGIIAASHLAGPYAVKKYLNSKGTFTTQDSLGTSIESYMKLFSNYKLDIQKYENKTIQ